MNTTYAPDNWIVIRFTNGVYKVLAGSSGGYLDGDAWKLNSGIVKAEEDGSYWNFTGSSGSVYSCHKDSYRVRRNNAHILRQILKLNPTVEIMDESTNWSELNYE